MYGTVKHFVVRQLVSDATFEGDGDIVFLRCVSAISLLLAPCFLALHAEALNPTHPAPTQPKLNRQDSTHTGTRHPTAVYGPGEHTEPLRSLVYDKSRVGVEEWAAQEEQEASG